MERAHLTDDFIGADQKMLERPAKAAFLGEVETAVRLGMKLLFGNSI